MELKQLAELAYVCEKGKYKQFVSYLPLFQGDILEKYKLRLIKPLIKIGRIKMIRLLYKNLTRRKREILFQYACNQCQRKIAQLLYLPGFSLKKEELKSVIVKSASRSNVSFCLFIAEKFNLTYIDIVEMCLLIPHPVFVSYAKNFYDEQRYDKLVGMTFTLAGMLSSSKIFGYFFRNNEVRFFEIEHFLKTKTNFLKCMNDYKCPLSEINVNILTNNILKFSKIYYILDMVNADTRQKLIELCDYDIFSYADQNFIDALLKQKNYDLTKVFTYICKGKSYKTFLWFYEQNPDLELDPKLGELLLYSYEKCSYEIFRRLWKDGKIDLFFDVYKSGLIVRGLKDGKNVFRKLKLCKIPIDDELLEALMIWAIEEEDVELIELIHYFNPSIKSYLTKKMHSIRFFAFCKEHYPSIF